MQRTITYKTTTELLNYSADVDSAYGGDSMIGDDTTSLRSYITDYVYENGRRYHRFREGRYNFPNDDVE